MINTKLDIIPQAQIQSLGLEALKSRLGVTGTLRFLEQYDHGGYGDYTREKYETADENLTKEEIMLLFQ